MNNKRIVKKYKLRGEVKSVIVLLSIMIIITMYLLYASNRIERIENTGNTEQESVNVEIKR